MFFSIAFIIDNLHKIIRKQREDVKGETFWFWFCLGQGKSIKIEAPFPCFFFSFFYDKSLHKTDRKMAHLSAQGS